MEIIMFFVACLAGLVQGVTGFGASIVMMMFLPIHFVLTQSAGISTAICLFLNLTMFLTYRKFIKLKTVLLPALLYIAVCSVTIYFSTFVNQVMMKKVFGVFLIILSIYYLFFNKSNERKKLSLPVSIFCIVVSAMCDGLFGIGGPLMVLYFLSQTHTSHEYLGTIQTFFLINCIYNTLFRISQGILTTNHFPIIGCGVLGIVLGGMMASKIVDRLDGVLLRKITYIMIGFSGLMNIL